MEELQKVLNNPQILKACENILNKMSRKALLSTINGLAQQTSPKISKTTTPTSTTTTTKKIILTTTMPATNATKAKPIITTTPLDAIMKQNDNLKSNRRKKMQEQFRKNQSRTSKQI